MTLRPLDITVIVVYFLGLLWLGLRLSTKQKSREDYFLGDRQVPWWLAGISVFATLLSTVTYVALPGEMIKNGIGFFTHLFAFLFIVPLVTWVVIPALMRLRVTSIYDYLEKRFGAPARTVCAAVFVFMRLIWLGLILYTAALAISPVTGGDMDKAAQHDQMQKLIIVSGIVTVFYTTLGGMRAVIWSDFAQFVILMGGAILIPIHVAFQTSSGPDVWWAAFSEAGRTEFDVFSHDPTQRTSVFGLILAIFFWNICTHSSDQVAAQRYLSTTSTDSARRAFWVCSVANIALVLLLMTTGLALFYSRFHQSAQSISDFQRNIAPVADKVLPKFIAGLPDGLSGLMVAALLAAAMSSLASGINSISTVIVSDLLPNREGSSEDSTNLAHPRVLAMGSGIVGIAFSLVVNYLMMHDFEWNLVDLIERVNHLFVGPLGAVFFSGMLCRHVGLAAVMLGFVAGVATSNWIAFSKWFSIDEVSFMWIMPASFAVTMGVAFVAGWFFSPPNLKQLDSLYMGRTRGRD